MGRITYGIIGDYCRAWVRGLILLLAIGWRKLHKLSDGVLRLQTYLDNHAQQHNRVMDEVKTQTHLLRDTFTPSIR